MKLSRLLLSALLLFPAAASAQEQYGTVYFYRGLDTPDYGTQIVILNPEAIVYLDGKEFLVMEERSFIGFKFPVGRYVIQMEPKGVRLVLDVKADKTYYVRIKQAVYPIRYRDINPMAEKTAIDEIRNCYALKAKKIKIKTFEAIRKEPKLKK